LVESLDLRPSNQYILVSESPSCLRLEKMCVCQANTCPPVHKNDVQIPKRTMSNAFPGVRGSTVGIATWLRTRKPISRASSSCVAADFFVSITTPAVGPTELPRERVQGLFLRRQSDSKADEPSLSSAEINNCQYIAPLHSVCFYGRGIRLSSLLASLPVYLYFEVITEVVLPSLNN
jgi:hypothetical protein